MSSIITLLSAVATMVCVVTSAPIVVILVLLAIAMVAFLYDLSSPCDNEAMQWGWVSKVFDAYCEDILTR